MSLMPFPLKLMAIGEFEASLATARLPIAAPVDLGAN